MELVLIILALVIVIIALIRLENRSAFRDRVRQLFYYAPDVRLRTYSESQIESLPPPVQRYFRLALKDGQPYVSFARLKHSGLFKTARNKPWSNIEGEQYFTIDRPGFVWKGATPLFSAQDMYLADHGRLVVYLFSMLKMVDLQNKQADEAELQRWLAESVWFPTALLPSMHLSWKARNENSAELHFQYKSHRLAFLVTFRPTGEIVSMSTERYMQAERRETWIGELSDYQQVGNFRVPTRVTATWLLEEGNHTYADFRINLLEFDQPSRF